MKARDGNIKKAYIDDGWSGTNFDRPGFQAMITDIEHKVIDTVIVKDLSRLGRDYIQVGYYIERFFPEHHIRFISINDGNDSFAAESYISDIMPFKAVLFDMVAKDTSKKIRASLDIKRKKGEFIGAFAPYGYQKDPSNKNLLIVDSETAKIVKKIFRMYTDEISMNKIADILNKEKVPCPADYKKQTSNYININARYGIWRQQTIKDILSNPTYMGSLTQGRSKKVSYKSKKHIRITKENWIVVQDTHEPLVSSEIFEIVQHMLNKHSSSGYHHNKANHLLSGLIFCGDCGQSLTFRRNNNNQKYFTLCSGYSRFKNCTRHGLYEEDLNLAVINGLRQTELSDTHIQAITAEVKKLIANPSSNTNEQRIRRIEIRQNELARYTKALYEDKVKGILSEKEFIEMNSIYKEEKNQLAEQLAQHTQDIKDQHIQVQNLTEKIASAFNFDTMERPLLTQLIEKIELFEDGRLKVYYRFSKP